MLIDRSCGWVTVVTLAIGSTLAATVSFTAGVGVALLPASLDEVSGLAQSRTNPDVFWIHNDSGDRPVVYAVSSKGALLGSYALADATAIDWEDMAIGPAPDGGSYLYLADIGDNGGERMSVNVYRVHEPFVDAGQHHVLETLTGVTRYNFVYEDGPRDAEGFMVDPLTNDFYVVSKRELDGNRLYRSVSPSDRRTNTLVRVGTFSLTGTTGADISPDGLQVLLRRYSSSVNSLTPPELAGSYWSRADGSVVLADLLAQPGQIVPLAAESQGEAIAFAADNRGFYTTGEHGSRHGETTAQHPSSFTRSSWNSPSLVGRNRPRSLSRTRASGVWRE